VQKTRILNYNDSPELYDLFDWVLCNIGRCGKFNKIMPKWRSFRKHGLSRNFINVGQTWAKLAPALQRATLEIFTWLFCLVGYC
jgi:hypothetical protein